MQDTALVVDDAQFMQDVLITMLNSLGIQSITTSSFKEAIRYYFFSYPLVVLLDANMQDKVSALDFVKEVLSKDPSANILVLVDEDEEVAKIEKFLLAGCKGVLTKPFTEDDLKAFLEELKPPRLLVKKDHKKKSLFTKWFNNLKNNFKPVKFKYMEVDI